MSPKRGGALEPESTRISARNGEELVLDFDSRFGWIEVTGRIYPVICNL